MIRTIGDFDGVICPKCGSVGNIKFIDEDDYYFHSHEVECMSCGNMFVREYYYTVDVISKMVVEKMQALNLTEQNLADRYAVGIHDINVLVSGNLIGLSAALYRFVLAFLDMNIDELTKMKLLENNEII